MATEKQSTVTIDVSAKLDGVKEGQETPDLHAYVFTNAGDFLGRQALSGAGSGKVSFSTPVDRRSLRVLIGPDVGKEVSYDELNRIGAVEKHVGVEGNKASLNTTISPAYWIRWPFRFCCVEGRVVKRIGPFYNFVDLNVCDATVEIYEVYPIFWILERVPPEILKKLREIIIQGPNGPINPPDPGPEFGMRGMTMERAAMERPSVDFPEELVASAKISSDLAFKQVLAQHPIYIYPWFCWYWPWFVWKHKICTTTTDCFGRFECCFLESRYASKPNLWFKVSQVINGVLTVIYEPYPIHCYTHWNYDCGSEITIVVYNDAARTCCTEPPVVVPDGSNWVILEAIGGTSPHQIRGSSLDASTQVAGDDHDRGWTRNNQPFGGLLRPRLRFRDTLIPIGVTHYQVSWAPHGTGTWQVLSSTVNRHYVYTVGGNPVYGTYNLGPKTVNGVPNLFEITPTNAPLGGDWAFPPNYEYDDLTSAYFDTLTVIPPAAAGKYDLKVELFDATGAPVNIAAKGVSYFVPSVDDLSGTIYTDNASSPGLNMVHGNVLIMTVHVDNNKCSASIGAPICAGVAPDPDCGGLHYTNGSTLSMPFNATHPNGFATYDFRVVRGASNTMVAVSGADAVGAHDHTDTESVSYMRGNCSIAAFSENLYVAATATDGWSRLSGYDASDVKAFLLEP